eukprot:4435994-Alexandrium_andersonii.AAC.1
MSASLVGSEMCIRDRPGRTPIRGGPDGCRTRGWPQPGLLPGRLDGPNPGLRGGRRCTRGGGTCRKGSECGGPVGDAAPSVPWPQAAPGAGPCPHIPESRGPWPARPAQRAAHRWLPRPLGPPLLGGGPLG